ncbi:hypothetical protein EES45_22880 [Streptomyces sp. ADI97-07]|uniref:hypothetical protein n=1 Tax=Streptomyces sp. ADI97-07 TaxID=1522762 RepID=UPI000F554655|nr:hypothetical protein [Streptomyces sp. ADI97-07]RPK76607.1 hypothetical protein EES45_22880 [Streptomyces sp. ADI97-07]
MGQTQDLAAALRRHSKQAGESSPTVRGSDWRMATVATVGAGAALGTVTTTDGIIARRLVSYDLPAVGDKIFVSQSSAGNWLALGPGAPTTGDGWQTPTFTAPWTNYGSTGYRLPRFRRDGQWVVIEGLAATGGTSVTGTSTVFTLPAGFRPNDGYAFPSIVSGGVARQLNVFSTGLVQFTSLPAGAIGYASLNCRFSLT